MSAFPDNDQATAHRGESVLCPAEGGGDERSVVLPPAVAAAARRMGGQMGGISTTEVVRRGLVLLDLLLSLDQAEELMVHDRAARRYERLRFAWEG